jgi:hypothetical protein
MIANTQIVQINHHWGRPYFANGPPDLYNHREVGLGHCVKPRPWVTLGEDSPHPRAIKIDVNHLPCVIHDGDLHYGICNLQTKSKSA